MGAEHHQLRLHAACSGRPPHGVENGLQQPGVPLRRAERRAHVEIADQALAVFGNVIAIAGDGAACHERKSVQRAELDKPAHQIG
jgi:hypothetical protein